MAFILTQLNGCFGGGKTESVLTPEERWELLSQVITLKSGITTYHGFQTEGAAPPPTPEAWIRKNTNRTFEEAPSHGTDVLGNGLYLSAEPTSNITFYSDSNHGKNKGSLLEIPLQAGTRLLALNDVDPNVVPLIQWLRDSKYHEKKIALLTELHIDGILYEWPGTFRHPLCKEKKKNLAVLLTNPKAIEWANLIALNDQKTSVSKIELTRARIHRFISKYDRGPGTLPLGIQTDDPIISEPEYNAFLQSQIIGCREDAEESPQFWNEIITQEKQIQEKWKLLLNQGLAEDTRVDRLAGVLAPRFINPPDWQRALKNGITHPEQVYLPAPQTWDNWLKVNDTLVQESLDKPKISVIDLKKWNRMALINTVPEEDVGTLKKVNNYGKNTSIAVALTRADIKNLKSKNLDWITLQCSENTPPALDLEHSSLEECRTIFETAKNRSHSNAFWNETALKMQQGLYQNEWYWYACWPREALTEGNELTAKNCGAVVYSEPEKTEKKLEEILTKIQTPQKNEQSIILTALKIQQQTVALHSFNRGNGRVSRWLMDRITIQNDLPPIHFINMDQDLSTSVRVLTLQALSSMKQNITLAEWCLNFEPLAECSQIPYQR